MSKDVTERVNLAFGTHYNSDDTDSLTILDLSELLELVGKAINRADMTKDPDAEDKARAIKIIETARPAPGP